MCSNMARINHLIFGYRIITVNIEDLATISSILLRNNYTSEIASDGKLYVIEKDYINIRNILSGRIVFSASQPMGLYGAWKKYTHKCALIISLLISTLLIVLFSNIVWDVRVDDSAGLNESELVVCLSDCGLSVGDFWWRLNLSEIETRFLKENSGVSWININRRGTVAYVSLMIKDDSGITVEKESNSYTNIVALYDCVIEEISVKRGVAMVQVGDTVKKGDLLILGVTTIGEDGEFCSAEGEVRGRVSERISVDLPRQYEKKSYIGRTIYSISLKLFKISINIFKRYGNLTKECDIIENEKEYSLGDNAPLPLSIRVLYIPRDTVSTEMYSDKDLTELACARLDLAVAARLWGCDLLRARSGCDLSNSGIIMYSDLTFIASVGETVTFDID